MFHVGKNSNKVTGLEVSLQNTDVCKIWSSLRGNWLIKSLILAIDSSTNRWMIWWQYWETMVTFGNGAHWKKLVSQNMPWKVIPCAAPLSFCLSPVLWWATLLYPLLPALLVYLTSAEVKEPSDQGLKIMGLGVLRNQSFLNRSLRIWYSVKNFWVKYFKNFIDEKEYE